MELVSRIIEFVLEPYTPFLFFAQYFAFEGAFPCRNLLSGINSLMPPAHFKNTRFPTTTLTRGIRTSALRLVSQCAAGGIGFQGRGLNSLLRFLEKRPFRCVFLLARALRSLSRSMLCVPSQRSKPEEAWIERPVEKKRGKSCFVGALEKGVRMEKKIENADTSRGLFRFPLSPLSMR